MLSLNMLAFASGADHGALRLLRYLVPAAMERYFHEVSVARIGLRDQFSTML
jgi:hypothetical protein